MENVFSSVYCFEAGDMQTTQVDGNLTWDNGISMAFDMVTHRYEDSEKSKTPGPWSRSSNSFILPASFWLIQYRRNT